MFGKKFEFTEAMNIEELLESLQKHKHWRKIHPDVLERIYHNGEDDLDAMKDFIRFSELTGLLRKNFIGIAGDEKMSQSMKATMFAITLERFAAKHAEKFFSRSADYDGPQNDFLIGTAELAYRYSILCNPYLLPSYVAMAILWSTACVRLDEAREWIQKYEQKEAELLKADDATLDTFTKSIRGKIPTFRAQIEKLATASLIKQ